MKTKTMNVRDNVLYMGEHSIVDLANTYKTPLYVYDEAHIRDKINTFINNFKSNLYHCEISYASKALLTPYLAKIISEYDMSVDAVSLGDLYLLEKSNFPMDKVWMHGNNKSSEELIYCLNNNIGGIIVDNIDELYEIKTLSENLNKKIKLLLRVNPGIEADTHVYIKTSLLSSKFGESIFDLDRIKEIIEISNASEYLSLVGFHAHIGSNIHNPLSFQSVGDVMVSFINKVKNEFGFVTDILNVGGGFGIRYTETDPIVDIALILKEMTNTINRKLTEYNLSIKKLVIEPGRSIVGDAGISIHTVGGIKNTYGGKKYVFVDGGMTDNIRPALYQALYTVDIANRFDQGNVEKSVYDVVGKRCESADIVTTNYSLGEVQKGDKLVTYCTGAYGYSMASNYNGALIPAVIFINGKVVKMANRRETLEDLVTTAIIPDQEVFDIHTDVLYDLYMSKKAGKVNRFRDVHVKQLNNSLITAGVWTMYSPEKFDLIEACKIAIDEINMNELPGFNVILGLEGLMNLEKVEDIEVLYEMGFRHAMLTWNEENRYATGVKGDPERGLTEEGIKLLKRMEQLDMIIDLAHLNDKSFFEALKVTKHNIIYSHGNIRSLCEHRRNVTDEHLQALKAVNGLLGLTLASSFIAKEKEDVTLDRFLDHVDYAVKFLGIDNVGFGFDFMDYLEEFANSNLEAVGDATKVNVLINGLRSRGYTESDIRKITYNNFFKRYNDKITLRG